MFQTKNKSIETIYFSKILSIDPLPTGIDTPSSQDGKYFDELTLAIVAFSNHKVSTTVEISDQTTVVDTDVYYSHESINVSDDATIGDTTKKIFLLGQFEGKLSSVDKKKSGKVFTIKYEYNTSEHWSIEEFAYYSS